MPRFRVWIWLAWVAVFVAVTILLRTYRDGVGTVPPVLLYLLVILGGSVGGGRPLGFALTLAGFLSIDFFFQAPYDTFSVGKPLDWLVLMAFLTTATVTTHLVTAERARAAEAAQRAREVASLGGVLAAVSHDLRTPLTTITALAQAGVARGDANARAIEEEANRLARLVADLLDLSRLRGGALPVHPELNTAEDLVGAAVRQTAGLFTDRALETKVDLAEPALVGRFDFVQSLRILSNLLGNAAHHTPPASPVELSVQREGASLTFAVSDRGPGVPPAERERIFEPFYRPAGAPADGGGAGLGLAIARRLAELQGGTVVYAPREGGGSIFTLRLPAGKTRH
ncbi:MAG TPA: ATP-binding protein [Gemmatimonadales bacterium]|jgi:two-component system sensor histidine kinase KdpD|nr:ATP-binding protein [Gemmatimonadales bacterium]